MDKGPHEWHRGENTISTDAARLDLDVIHGYLATSYWVPDIARDLVETAVQHSLCFGLYRPPSQIGFARVVTDYARFGYLCDVFVLEEHRGQGLGKWLIECVLDCPTLAGLVSIGLATRDAHTLYEAFGWQRLNSTDHLMMLRREPTSSS